jgi:G3E family GTPase
MHAVRAKRRECTFGPPALLAWLTHMGARACMATPAPHNEQDAAETRGRQRSRRSKSSRKQRSRPASAAEQAHEREQTDAANELVVQRRRDMQRDHHHQCLADETVDEMRRKRIERLGKAPVRPNTMPGRHTP